MQKLEIQRFLQLYYFKYEIMQNGRQIFFFVFLMNSFYTLEYE